LESAEQYQLAMEECKRQVETKEAKIRELETYKIKDADLLDK